VTRYCAALSEHPDATEAIGEVLGQLLDQLGDGPDLVAMFVTEPHARLMGELAATVRGALRPARLIGATAVSVIGGSREAEYGPAISLWGARWNGVVTPVHLDVDQRGDQLEFSGFPEDAAADAKSLMLLADPFSFPAEQFLSGLSQAFPHLTVVGGLASAARGPGGNHLVLDDVVTNRGAVGVLLDQDVAPRTVVSQGCRPIGAPFTVTKAEGNMLIELGGQPALNRLLESISSSSPEDRMLAERGLHCGIVADERHLEYRRGDFLVRGVLGADRDSGAVAIGDVAPVGSTVQFQVRDGASADEDLRELLTAAQADAALVFTCNGRGVNLFGEPHHDAEMVARMLDTSAVGGMFCAGELGPIGSRNALHGFTASIALFR
jgi:small ligand-binding sensory domain FIST